MYNVFKNNNLFLIKKITSKIKKMHKFKRKIVVKYLHAFKKILA